MKSNSGKRKRNLIERKGRKFERLGHGRALAALRAEAARYPVVVEWSIDDGLYLATLPDLGGMIVSGASQTEALRRARVAAVDWLYGMHKLGRPIPAPSRIALPA